MPSPLPLPAHELRPAASAEAIHREEQALGVPLPAGYRAYLLRHNGGWLYGDLIRLYGVGSGAAAVAAAPVDDEGATDPSEGTIASARRDLQEWDPEGWPPAHIAFAAEGGTGVFCFDSRQRGDDGECPLYYRSWVEDGAVLIARTFDEWLAHVERLALAREDARAS